MRLYFVYVYEQWAYEVLNSQNTPLVKSPSFVGDGSVSDVIDNPKVMKDILYIVVVFLE
jgi:hypothetical protein